MTVAAARGVILEELVLHLLKNVGYRIVQPGMDGTRKGHSGLEIEGRGERHQIDAFAAYDHTPAFMYPLRLMVEAKCYSRNRPIGVEVARNSVGVHKDISENYFSYRVSRGSSRQVSGPRFNYQSAIFSTSGYTTNAQRYAIAHQLFLIQYENIRLLEPIITALLGLTSLHLKNVQRLQKDTKPMARLRRQVRDVLDGIPHEHKSMFSALGLDYLTSRIIGPLVNIRGSYFGMLQGKWPLHLLSEDPLPPNLFENRNLVMCRVYSYDASRWAFAPIGLKNGDAGWFELQFDIPEEIANYILETEGDPRALAQIKQQQFSYLDLTGQIGGIHRQVRLQLDERWLHRYLETRRS